MASVSVFVVDDGARAASVRSVVETWTRAGLLSPSVWVSASQIAAGTSGAPVVTALVVNADRTDEVDLFAYIGRRRLDLVRVVVGHLIVEREAEPPGTLPTIGRSVAELIATTLPRRSDVASGVGCQLHRTVVVVPATGVCEASEAAFQPDWDANVVVSPEDRPDGDRASVFVRYPGNYDGHAAAALCAVGGIFVGVDAGVLDDMTVDSSARAGDGSVVRVGVRTVVGEDVLDRVTSRALDAAALGADGPSHALDWARAASSPELVTKAAATHLLAQHEFAPSPPPPSSMPAREHEGLIAAVRAAAAFNVRTVGAVTSWALSRGRDSIERSATEAIVGTKGGVLVTLGPQPVDELTRVSERLLERERARLDEAMRLDAARTDAPPPSTWTKLRELAFGLADGGDLGDFPAPRQAGTREIVPSHAVVVPPGEAWTTRDGARILAQDPHAMRGYLRYLSDERAKARDALASARESLRFAEATPGESHTMTPATRASRRKSKGKPSAHTEGASGGRTESTPADTTEPLLDSTVTTPNDEAMAILRAEMERCERAIVALREEESQYIAWFEGCSASMLWQVADDVGERALEMRARQERLESADARDQAPPSDELKGAQTALMARWRGAALLWLLTVAFAVFAHVHHFTEFEPLAKIRMSRGEMWWSIGVVSALALVLLGLANHRFYKAVRSYEWLVEQRVAQMAHEKATYVHVGHERARFELLHGALQDWIRIVGEVVHRPWSPTAARHLDVPDDVVDVMPAAMAVARQLERSGAVPTGVVLEAMNVVYQPGWCSRAFEVAYEAWEREQSSVADEGHRITDLDASNSATGPRRRLTAYWSNGTAQQVCGNRARRVLVDAVQDGTLVLPERVVARVGRYTDGESATESEFLRATATESIAFATDAFSAPARQARRHYVEKSIAWVPSSARLTHPADGVEVRAASSCTAVRVDISPRVSASDLTPFAGAAVTDDYSMEDLIKESTDVQGAWY